MSESLPEGVPLRSEVSEPDPVEFTYNYAAVLAVCTKVHHRYEGGRYLIQGWKEIDGDMKLVVNCFTDTAEAYDAIMAHRE